MYKVTLELTSGLLEVYIDNILQLGKVILEHQEEYTGCSVQRIGKEEHYDKRTINQIQRPNSEDINIKCKRP